MYAFGPSERVASVTQIPFPIPVDASKAGEGQLEISINDGDVRNAVQVLGGGKCLVTYTPEQPITHEIEVSNVLLLLLLLLLAFKDMGVVNRNY